MSARKRGGHRVSPGPQGGPRSASVDAILRAVILVAAGIFAYWPAFSSPFLFDDQTAIVDNATIRSLTPLSSALSPPRDTPVAGRPLVNLTLAANYAADGLNPRGYRMVNLAIHLLAGLALFGVVRRALTLPALGSRFDGVAIDVAFAASLLWTLHPLQSEVVNYVTERTESVMGLCYFLTIYCSLRSSRAKPSLHKERVGQSFSFAWAGAAIVACAAGMASKESMVTAPVMVLLIDRVLAFGSWREAFRARGRLYGGLAATWVVLAAIMASAPRTSAGFGSGTGAWVYLLNQAQVVAHYLKLSLWPRALVLDYGLPQPLTLADVWLPGAVVVTLILLTIAALVYRPALGLLGTWFFITLAPTSSIVPISTEVGAERRMYLPLAAIVVLIVVALHEVCRASLSGSPRGPEGSALQATRVRLAPQRVVVALLAALMIAGVHLRNRDYASPLAMSQTIVDRWPNGRGHFMLGTSLIESGRQEEGMAQLRESARDYPGALFAIGTEQLGAGQMGDGIATLERFVVAMPGHPTVAPAREMLARAHATQGNLPAAEQQLRLLLAAAPRYIAGHDLLGRVLAGQGQFNAAATAFQQVLVLQPGNVEAQQNLAAAQRLAAGAGAPVSPAR